VKRRAAAIELKIPDNAAYTALTALRRLGVDAGAVRRSEIWCCDADGDEAAFAARIRGDAAIYNPNLHRLIVLPSAQPRPGEVWIGRRSDEGAARRRYVGWRLEHADGTPVRREVLRAAVDALLCNPAIESATY
jgi:phosphoribosylformylglycinamidine (FGAM) synthase PurS component